VPSVAVKGFVRWCGWLHTAAVTGSKPVTPTSTNTPPDLQGGARCQQIVSKPRDVVIETLGALCGSRI
jgi:hypothetical protein